MPKTNWPTTSQSFDLNGVGSQRPAINAFQVRTVPEPALWVEAVAAVACGGLAMRRARRG